MEQRKFKKAIFVDDNQNNLKTCNNYPQIKQILAIWGNCQPGLIGHNQNEALNEIKKFFEI